MRSFAAEYKHGDSGCLYCGQFIRLVAYVLVVRDDDPSAPANFDNPFFVLCVIRKVIDMPLDRNPRVLKERRELFAEIAISEENSAQAARS